MSLAEELKHLITIRDSLSSQLANIKSTSETTENLNKVVATINKRIELVLDTMISEDVALKEANVRTLQETKSSWFNDLSRSILQALAVRELVNQINLTEIFHVFFEFLK
jgi:hypothetical protein